MVKTPPKHPTAAGKPGTKVAKPAAARPPPSWPTQQQVAELAEMLDELYPDAQAMLKLDERLGEATNYTSRKRIFQEAEQIIEDFAKTGWRHSIKNGRLQKKWDECCPESWRPEDSDSPAYGEVAKMITILMGSFPTSKIPDPEIFVQILLDDVMALTPSFVEMESTCRQLRKTKTFMPAISEVIKTLEEQQKLWNRRESTIAILEEFYDNLCEETARFKAAAPEEERQIKEAEERRRIEAARSQPLAVGDRVRAVDYGAGTVLMICPQTYGDTQYMVCFDFNKHEYFCGRDCLERLISGDEGFEPVAMVEYRNAIPLLPAMSQDAVKVEKE